MSRKKYAWKACRPRKGLGSSNLPHSAIISCADGGCEGLPRCGKGLQDVATCSEMFDKSLTNEDLFDKCLTQKKKRMKGINVSLTWRDRPGKDGSAPVLLSVCYDRKTSYLPAGVKVRPGQWDKVRKKVVNHERASTLNSYLLSLLGRAEDAVLELQRDGGVRAGAVAQVKDALAGILYPEEVDNSVLAVMEEFMSKKDRPNTKDKYLQTKVHIERWLGSSARKVRFQDVTPEWLSKFDKYLLQYCPSQSSRSIHMRNLRAVFNYALEQDLTDAAYPFKKYKIKVAQTEPTALTLEQLRLLWHCEPPTVAQRYWLDVWKLMFCLIGINMVDLCALDGVKQGRVIYTRSKTGRMYSIKVEPEAAEVLGRRKGRRHFVDVLERVQDVKNATLAINRRMQEIAEQLKLPHITAYTARYTWASLAASIDVPIEVISQALGHSYGMAVTLGYIVPDRRKVDEANRKVLDLLCCKADACKT